MRSTIEDICQKLQNGQYSNEEQVRFSLVGRILQILGWNIWNPEEVYTEFPAVKSEDNTRVDIALFLRPKRPDVYIEIKSHNKVVNNLAAIERQLRDYNRNNTATFTIITDGQLWRFYYSQTQGEFSDKCYREINLIKDDPQQIEDEFEMLLSKQKIESGEARRMAEEYLELSIIERTIQDSIPEALKRMDADPLLNKVQAIQGILNDKGYQASDTEIVLVLKKDLSLPTEISRLPVRKTALDVKTFPPTQATLLLPEKLTISQSTVLEVSINGRTFCDKKSAMNTFKEVLKNWGIQRILSGTAVKSKFPLFIQKEELKKYSEDNKKKYSFYDNDYFVYCNTSTYRKKQFLEIIAEQLKERIDVKIIDKQD